MPIKDQYSELLKMTSPCEKLIRRDIARTYPEHNFFKEKDSLGQEGVSQSSFIREHHPMERGMGKCEENSERWGRWEHGKVKGWKIRGGGGGHFACGIRKAAQLLEQACCPDPTTCSVAIGKLTLFSVPPFSYLSRNHPSPGLILGINWADTCKVLK